MTPESLLAYVFWHWRQPSADRNAYESAQQAFQQALTASPSVGFVRSFSHAIVGAPWANQGAEAYEDWYLVRDSAALDLLDAAAVTAGRKSAHDAAAALAANGTAGLFQLRAGTAPAPERAGSGLSGPRWAQWFQKPAALSYAQIFAAVTPALAPVGGSLWVRKMTLGPSPEFCVLAREPAALAPQFQMFAFQLRPVWDGALVEVTAR